MRREDYLQLIDWTGRQLIRTKRGRIAEQLPPLLEHLDMGAGTWLSEMKHYGRWYYRAVGSFAAMQRYCQHLGQHWLKGSPTVLGKIT